MNARLLGACGMWPRELARGDCLLCEGQDFSKRQRLAQGQSGGNTSARPWNSLRIAQAL
jgi:hypothetical protein